MVTCSFSSIKLIGTIPLIVDKAEYTYYGEIDKEGQAFGVGTAT